jgi:hypothetical protein
MSDSVPAGDFVQVIHQSQVTHYVNWASISASHHCPAQPLIGNELCTVGVSKFGTNLITGYGENGYPAAQQGLPKKIMSRKLLKKDN